MKVTLRILAQYFENYSDTETPHFKPKGTQYFEAKTDSELMLYVATTDIAKVCEEILNRHSNDIVKFIYVSHEVIFSEPIQLEEAEVHAELLKHFD
jgi:hypothetical protein